MKTYYLWDLGGTLFPEKWDSKKSGVPSFDAYVESLGNDLATVAPWDYEQCYKVPYIEGLYDLSVAKGFEDVLVWTKHNGVFTTGLPIHVEWRAIQLMRKYNFDPRPFLPEIFSTFDYGNTNKKTQDMLVDVIRKKLAQGFSAVMYTDDKLANCEQFYHAAEKVKVTDPEFTYRIYHILNDNNGIRRQDYYWEIGSLYDLKDNELKFIQL
jgi:hypothetical protein